MKLSLRRSLCIMLLVVATALSSYAATAEELLDVIKSQLTAYLPAIRSNSATQVQTLSKLDSALSDISDLVSSISDSLSTDSDYSAIVSELQTLRDTCASYTDVVNSISSALDAIENNQITSDDLTTAFASANHALQSLTTYNQLQSLFSSLEEQITAISLRLDSTLDVSGQIDVSSASLGPVVTAVENVRQKLFDIETWWLAWVKDEWGPFTDRFEDLRGYVYSIMQAVQSIDVYLNGEFREKFHDVWTNNTTYLPFLTNLVSDLSFDYLTNELAFALSQVSRAKLVPYDDTHPVATFLQHLYYQLVGTPRANFYKNGSVGLLKTVPGATSASQISDFFTRGTIRPTELEGYLHNYVDSQMDQRRWIYEISNTVPYIEGLPYRKVSLSDDGDGWVSAWGNYNWNTDGDTISLTVDGRSGGHTPWNNQYFANDYFADLLKFLARTNLLQNAAYYDSVLAVLGLTNSVPSYDEIDPPEDLDWEEPSDVQKQLDELPDAEHILPTEFETVDSPEYSSFISGSSDKLGYALNDPVDQQSDVITLFPRVPSILSYSAVVPSPELFHFEDYMTASDRRAIHDFFAIIWRLIYYVFAVYKVMDLIKSFFVAS